MNFVTHYLNTVTRHIACINGGRAAYQPRSWTVDKKQVTCQKCLARIAKWEGKQS